MYGVRYYSDGTEREGWQQECERMWQALDNLGITELAHGGAKGADTLAGEWAVAKQIPVKVYPADWNNPAYQRTLPGGRVVKWAGNVRNQEMMDDFNPDAVVAFPGGTGTADMRRRAQAADVAVIPG